jgi:hypothetical protein
MTNPVFKARFTGKCAACGRLYRPGERIVGQGQGQPALHQRCAAAHSATPRPHRRVSAERASAWDAMWASAHARAGAKADEYAQWRAKERARYRADKATFLEAAAAAEWDAGLTKSDLAKVEAVAFPPGVLYRRQRGRG